MAHIAYVENENIREISKKEKFLGLNVDSFIFSFFASCWLLSFAFFHALLLMFFFILTFYILEFFDEDITAILLNTFTLKNDTRIYYA